MAPSEHLFRLIKSLSKAEKRHFRVSLGSGATHRNYLQLFRAVDAQPEYDESAIRTKFRNHAFTRQLHVAKNYLMRLVLRSLRGYHAKLSKETELRDRVHEIEILFRRDLFDLCQRVIARAESTARRYEKYEILLEILAWKRRLILTRHGAFERHEELARLLEDEGDVIERLRAINHLQRLFIESTSASAVRFDRTPPRLIVPDLAYSDSLRLAILHAHLTIAQQTFANDPDAAEATMDRLVVLLEDHPERLADDPEAYVTVLGNKVGFALRRGDKDEVVNLVRDVRAVPSRFPRRGRAPLPVRTVLRAYNIELELYRDTRDVARGIELIGEIEAYLRDHARSIPKDYALLFRYQFAHLRFLAREYPASLRELNEIINGAWGTIREDIQNSARMLHLVIHYELGNISLLRYAVESHRRYYRKRRALESYERTLLRFFGALSISPPRNHPALFRNLETQLFTAGSEQADADVLDYVDLKTWLAEKNGRPTTSTRHTS